MKPKSSYKSCPPLLWLQQPSKIKAKLQYSADLDNFDKYQPTLILNVIKDSI